MIADIFILVLILGYCAFLIYRGYKLSLIHISEPTRH